MDPKRFDELMSKDIYDLTDLDRIILLEELKTLWLGMGTMVRRLNTPISQI